MTPGKSENPAVEHPKQWPAKPWRLTAAESYVLEYDPVASGAEPLQLALKELIVRGALRIEQLKAPWPLGLRRGVTALKTGTRNLATPDLPLAAALELFERTSSGDTVLLKDFAKAARQEFTRSLAGYLNLCVFPSIERRGLLRAEEQERFGRRTRRRYTWTAAGQDAAKELDEWLTVGRQRMRIWARHDPATGRAYAQAAGASVLLMSNLYPDLELLAKHAWPPAVAADGGGLAVGAGIEPTDDPLGPAAESFADVGALDFSGLQGDFGGLKGLGDAFSAIDFGIADGGGGGGGGGGGDGGGGS